MIFSSIGQGLIWGILGLGIFMTYRILNFPDMTAEGSFPLGGAVCVAAIVAGMHPIVATILAIFAGMLAGLVTGLLYTKGKIPVILAGILVMSSLNAVMLYVMKRPNLSLLNQPKLLDFFQNIGISQNFDRIFLGLIASGIIIIGLYFFFNTEFGQGYIATGDNEEMVRSSSINADVSRIGGVMISNALVAFSGALLCQYQKYADLNCGNGMLVMGLASVIIGLTFFGTHSVTVQAVGVVLGSLLYRIIIQLAYKVDMPSYAVKLLSAVIVVIALVIPWLQKNYKKKGGSRK